MLTEEEQEWLKNRKSLKQTTCENCGWYKFRSRVSWMEYWSGCHDSRGDGRCTGIDVLKEAAEFEARVCLLVGLSRTPNDCNICPDRNNYETCMADFKRRMGWPCDSAQAAAWFNHKMARLAVEEEMDNDRARL